MSSQTEYQRRYRAEHPMARILYRWQNRTRGRALERLAVEFPGRFAELVEQERRADPDPRLAKEES